jgi:hypothetical protein
MPTAVTEPSVVFGPSATGRPHSVSCDEFGVTAELCLADFSRLGDFRFQYRELLRRGAGLCVILHRSVLDEANSNLWQQALTAAVPTWLIDSEEGRLYLSGEGGIRTLGPV